jgi:2-dehydropantoate 2-reductase
MTLRKDTAGVSNEAAKALRVSVIGGGSVGLAVAASLALAGAEVTLLVRASAIEALQGAAITIGGMMGDHRIEAGRIAIADAAAPPSASLAADVVIVTTKAQGVTEVLQPFGAIGGPKPGAVLLMQNGLGSAEAGRAVLGPSVPVFSAVMYIGMQKQGVAHIAVNAFASPVMAGPLLGDDISALQPLLDLAPAGFVPFVHAPDLRQKILTKLLFNSCMNPTGALTGRTYGQLLENPHSRALITQLADETLRVYAAVEDFRPALDGADYVDNSLMGIVFPKSAPHRSSMAQDIETGRQTEIAFLNGAIARLGEKAGIPTPCHNTIVQLIRARERV